MKIFLESFWSVFKYATLPNAILYSFITVEYHSLLAFIFALLNAILFRYSLR